MGAGLQLAPALRHLWRRDGMDRRDFLKTSGAAAAAAGVMVPAVAETAPKAPAILPGVHRLALASSWGADLPGQGPERLAHRIETATDGRYRIEIENGNVDADLTFGSAGRHATLHPAFALFAGLPGAQGLEAQTFQTWFAAGGGDMLWEDLAAQFGFKPLIAGHTGPSAGVWAAARLDEASDLAGAKLHVEGLAADVARALGATPTLVPAPELKDALAGRRLDAAEWLGPLAAAAADLQPLAQRLYEPGLNRHGLLLSLAVERRLWDGMSAADRAIFEACAAHECQLSLADARTHALIAAQLAGPAKWPVRLAFSPQLTATVDRAAAEVVERVAGADALARRICDSYQAFRRLLAEPPTA
jgi:TRAP-type mannitol/chloroaromatic compound transport system substrate-binding protein